MARAATARAPGTRCVRACPLRTGAGWRRARAGGRRRRSTSSAGSSEGGERRRSAGPARVVEQAALLLGGDVVDGARWPFLGGRADLDDIELIEADALCQRGIADVDVPVMALALVDVWSRPAVALGVEVDWLRLHRGHRAHGPLPPLRRRAERMTGAICRSG